MVGLRRRGGENARRTLLAFDGVVAAPLRGRLSPRPKQVLVAYHLSPMARAGVLRTKFEPGEGENSLRSHPQQAYRLA